MIIRNAVAFGKRILQDVVDTYNNVKEGIQLHSLVRTLRVEVEGMKGACWAAYNLHEKVDKRLIDTASRMKFLDDRLDHCLKQVLEESDRLSKEIEERIDSCNSQAHERMDEMEHDFKKELDTIKHLADIHTDEWLDDYRDQWERDNDCISEEVPF